jgi:hypothetical protein
MRFVEYTDYGDAPVIFVSGAADVSLVDDTVEIVLFVRVKLSDGTFENRVAARLRQSWRRYLEEQQRILDAMMHIAREADRFNRPLLTAAHH